MKVRWKLQRKVKWKKRMARVFLALGVACVMMAGCGKDEEKDDGLISFSTQEADEEDSSYGVGGDAGDKEPSSAVEQEASGEKSGRGAQNASADDSDGTTPFAKGEEEVPVEEVYVHVCGSVNNPGVYKLKPEARIYEAIEAAGGLCADASAESVNQAQKVEDGLKIYVPNKEEAEHGWAESSGAKGVLDGSGDGGQAQEPSAKVNVNTATVEELKTLPGIGDAKARSIVSYRQTNGMFQSIEDLMQVEGIKSGVFDKIKDQITV